MPSPARTVRQSLFGDVPLDEWVSRADGGPEQPWNYFERARRLAHAGRLPEAVQIWQWIAAADRLETRHLLQAWHFLRQAGCPPADNRAKLVLGAVAEMPVQGAHDVLAAYRDGTARYVNYSGQAVVWDDRSDQQVQAAINRWLIAGQVIANTVGPWEEPSLPPVAAGDARLMVLTPGGPHFGQGPAARLSASPRARPFATAATSLVELIISRARG